MLFVLGSSFFVLGAGCWVLEIVIRSRPPERGTVDEESGPLHCDPSARDGISREWQRGSCNGASVGQRCICYVIGTLHGLSSTCLHKVNLPDKASALRILTLQRQLYTRRQDSYRVTDPYICGPIPTLWWGNRCFLRAVACLSMVSIRWRTMSPWPPPASPPPAPARSRAATPSRRHAIFHQLNVS